MLEIRNLRKSYGTVNAVKEVNLTIREGEFFSLLGPSGCGKTTLLRMLGGFESPTSGEIHLNGSRVDQLPPNERPFNLVFQRYALFPHLSVWENVAFGLKMKKISPLEIKSRVAEALALVQMEGFGVRGIQTLSGGQQQRIALARALVNRPKVLLLDEPLSALDLKLRQQMQVELLALQRRLKHTFIFVTHDQDEALTLSDRIAVMNQGVVEQVGTAQEIYEFPQSLFVAKFIGTVNSLDGTVASSDSRQVSVQGLSGSTWSVRPSRDGIRPLPNVEAGAAVHILIRPEKLRLLKASASASSGSGDQNRLEGVLKEILCQGPITQFLVQLPDDNLPPIIVSQPNAALTARRSFSLGERVTVAWSSEDSVLMKRDVSHSQNLSRGVAEETVHSETASSANDLAVAQPVGAGANLG